MIYDGACEKSSHESNFPRLNGVISSAMFAMVDLFLILNALYASCFINVSRKEARRSTRTVACSVCLFIGEYPFCSSFGHNLPLCTLNTYAHFLRGACGHTRSECLPESKWDMLRLVVERRGLRLKEVVENVYEASDAFLETTRSSPVPHLIEGCCHHCQTKINHCATLLVLNANGYAG